MSIVLEKGQRRARHAYDQYETPRKFVESGLALVEGMPESILDPGAYKGIWGEVAREKWPQAVWVTGVEIQASPPPLAYNDWHSAQNYLDYVNRDGFDLVIGNPPYALAEAFVRHSLSLLRFGGVCVFLLRLAFLESQGRGMGLFREHPPEEVSVCMKRPTFYGIAQGATAFAFVKWRLNHKGPTTLTWSQT